MEISLHSITLQLVTIHQLYSFLGAEPLFGASIERIHGRKLPFVVLIAKKSSGCQAEKHICTGSLITKNHVLTDARCLEVPLESIQAIAGSTDVNSRYHKRFDIASGITYKQWMRLRNLPDHPEKLDIGILKLAVHDTGIKPAAITLHEKKYRLPSSLKVIGWGQTPESFCPEQPRIAPLFLLEEEDCENRLWWFDPDYKKNVLSGELVCAKSERVLFGVEGDYGAPIVNKENSVIGILFRRHPLDHQTPAIPDLPNLVLRMIGFTKFISKIIADSANPQLQLGIL
ncbi:hypothetical protein QAD02_011957 [Eretmocerus hayati]|uniref:Uncharacterized protein n=1 Tax=Eretmocerus hayati TaxID=131215 RepID=A0ACC2NZD1_9HYME|nr:hypothetical protein QAD02_011957 [Eretmocerus hayati]